MSKRISTSLVLAIMLIWAGTAFGILGAPRAQLKSGQWAVGFDYWYTSTELDIKTNDAFGNHVGSVISQPKHFKMNRYLPSLIYGASDDVELYVLLGSVSSKASIDISSMVDPTAESGSVFAYGFGTRATLCRRGQVDFGTVLQILRTEGLGVDMVVDRGEWLHVAKGTLNMTEVLIALGPTWQWRRNVLFYGGPFMHFIWGSFRQKEYCTIDGLVRKASDDVREDSWFGGYVGAQVEVFRNTPFTVEWQHTAHSNSLNLGLRKPF